MSLFLSSFVSGWAAVLRSPGHAHPIRKFIPKAVAERFLPATLQCNPECNPVADEQLHARAQLSAKSAEAWHQKSIIECSFRLSGGLPP